MYNFQCINPIGWERAVLENDSVFIKYATQIAETLDQKILFNSQKGFSVLTKEQIAEVLKEADTKIPLVGKVAAINLLATTWRYGKQLEEYIRKENVLL